MNLLILTQYFWPENFKINDLVSELVQRGHQVTVLTAKPNYPDGFVFKDFVDNPEKFSTYQGAKVIRVPLVTRGKGGWRLILNYFSFAGSATAIGLWKLRDESFHAILSFGPSPITVALPAIAIRKQKRIPLFFWVQDLWPDTLQALGVVRNEHILNIIGKLVAFVYNRCDLILAQSHSFIPQIRRYTQKTTRVQYYPNWSEKLPDLEYVTAAPEVIADNNKFNIVFAGNIGEAQDFPAILTAAEYLKHNDSIRWLIIGSGRQAGWVASEIIKRGLEKRVVMLGRHPPERMPSFFKHADALLVSLRDTPIFSMTIPGKVQTYLAMGIPIIAMLNGEGADIIEKSQAGLTCPAGNSQQLAEVVLNLFHMSLDERQRMGDNGKILNETIFNRENLISRLEEWLSNTKLNERNV